MAIGIRIANICHVALAAEELRNRFIPSESRTIPACPDPGRDRGRQTGMAGKVQIEFQFPIENGGKSPVFSNGVSITKRGGG